MAEVGGGTEIGKTAVQHGGAVEERLYLSVQSGLKISREWHWKSHWPVLLEGAVDIDLKDLVLVELWQRQTLVGGPGPAYLPLLLLLKIALLPQRFSV